MPIKPGKYSAPEDIQFELKGAMSHTAHVRDEALHLENVRQLFQVLRELSSQINNSV